MIGKLKSDNLWTFFNKKALRKSTSSGQITCEGTQTRRDTSTASLTENRVAGWRQNSVLIQGEPTD